jgi:hypothetical protein
MLVLGCLTCGAFRADAQTGNLQESTEIRWFFPGTVPADVHEWFNSGGRLGEAVSSEGEREDLYFISSGNPHLGTKLREGDLEIKERGESRELREAIFAGRAEHWRKWSWQYADDKSDFDSYFDGLVVAGFKRETSKDSWIEIGKNRRRRAFQFNEIGALTPTVGRVSSGVLAEITEVSAGRQSWWTIACEVVNADKPFEKLVTGLTWILEDYPGPRLSIAESYSYPEWLLLSGLVPQK